VGFARAGWGRQAEGRASFLKKRSKKLLDVWLRRSRLGRVQIRKSFLLLFFKKEALPFLRHRVLCALQQRAVKASLPKC
jgi:hypothetical protein